MKCMSTQNMNPVIIDLGSLGLEKDYYQPKDSALFVYFLYEVNFIIEGLITNPKLMYYIGKWR
jgi:hypothetical protein